MEAATPTFIIIIIFTSQNKRVLSLKNPDEVFKNMLMVKPSLIFWWRKSGDRYMSLYGENMTSETDVICARLTDNSSRYILWSESLAFKYSIFSSYIFETLQLFSITLRVTSILLIIRLRVTCILFIIRLRPQSQIKREQSQIHFRIATKLSLIILVFIFS